MIMLKKPSLLLPACSNLHTLYGPQPSPLNASTSHQFQRVRHRRPRNPQCRRHAATRSEKTPDSHDDLHWPDLASATALPTPYQILKLKKSAPYSKRRFYELVKLYHPDRHGHENGHSATTSLPGAVRMERYRLIVAAHEILSDPAKRSAYDASGAGWNGRPEQEAPKYHWGRKNETKWSGFDTNDSPFRNATWEDWERWYQRDNGDKAKQEPLYFSNGGFLVLVLTAVFVGGYGQTIRLGDYSNMLQRQVGIVHNDAGETVRKRRIESQGFGNRDERLQNFLRTRDPQHGYEITDSTDQKLLPEAVV